MRIHNFYPSNMGKMVLDTFQLHKGAKKSKRHMKAEHNGHLITNPEEITTIMKSGMKEQRKEQYPI
jgi:hypothetical protein